MNYKVLYRKYRPDTFDNLIGQENIVKILKNSIINDKISHAYIFSGPRGTGKTSTAKIFAKSINCLDSKNGSPCNECINCINSETSSDIIEIDAASNNGVDEIREITNNIKLAPNMLKYKVYIIDEVHMLSQSAFNALLLTLEEPPGHVVFILATTNIESVPITILSRCQRFDFKKITNIDIENTIKSVCKKENIRITDDAVKEIAYLSDGGLRDCLSILDQLSKEDKEITIEIVSEAVGNISNQVIIKFINLLEKRDSLGILNEIDLLSSRNSDVKLFIKALIDGICIKVKNIVVKNENSEFGVEKYKNLAFELTEFINNISISVDSYALLQILVLSYFANSELNYKSNDADEPKEVKKEEKKIEIEVKDNKDSINVYDYTDLLEVRVNNCFVDVSKEEKNVHIKRWQDYIFECENKIKGLIMDSEVVAASNKILVVKVERENDLDKIYSVLSLIEEKYNKYIEKNIKIVIITGSMWKKYSEEYINNLKQGKKYEYKEEVINNELSDIVSDIFAEDKIEER